MQKIILLAGIVSEFDSGHLAVTEPVSNLWLKVSKLTSPKLFMLTEQASLESSTLTPRSRSSPRLDHGSLECCLLLLLFLDAYCDSHSQQLCLIKFLCSVYRWYLLFCHKATDQRNGETKDVECDFSRSFSIFRTPKYSTSFWVPLEILEVIMLLIPPLFFKFSVPRYSCHSGSDMTLLIKGKENRSKQKVASMHTSSVSVLFFL